MKILKLKCIPILLLKTEDLLTFRDPQFMQLFIRKLIDIQSEQKNLEKDKKRLKKKEISLSLVLDADIKEDI